MKPTITDRPAMTNQKQGKPATTQQILQTQKRLQEAAIQLNQAREVVAYWNTSRHAFPGRTKTQETQRAEQTVQRLTPEVARLEESLESLTRKRAPKAA